MSGWHAQSSPDQPILLVPGFVGLGVPHWVPELRGVLFGLSCATSPADLARAVLEGVAFQVADLIAAADEDMHQPLAELRVDGGMGAIAGSCNARPICLAAPSSPPATMRRPPWAPPSSPACKSASGPISTALCALTQTSQRFVPLWDDTLRSHKLKQWRRAVKMVIDFYTVRDVD